MDTENIVGRWIFQCRYVKNYDGDTLTLDLDLGFGVWTRQQVRLYGIDTPEKRGGNELTKWLAEQADLFVGGFCREPNDLWYESVEWSGKYGRPIGKVWNGEANLTELLIAANLGLEYYGGSRRDHRRKFETMAANLIERNQP